MQYHIESEMPELHIFECPGQLTNPTYESFEEVKAAAIEELQGWPEEFREEREELIEWIRKARRYRDLYAPNATR